MKFAVIIPTLNAGAHFAELLANITAQSVQPTHKLVVDSSSADNTISTAQKFGWETEIINPQEFDHGQTRQMAWQNIVAADAATEFIIFLTQDVRITNPHSFANLLASFSDSRVGAAYGRQLPHADASLSAKLQREFSYPPASRRKTLQDAAALGIRAPFLSDAFAAYRVTALTDVGGFPVTDIGEDMYVGGRLLLKGWTIQYEAKAEVFHSHDFSLVQNWRRYSAMGAFYRRNFWLKENFGASEGAGLKLLKRQIATAYSRKSAIALLTMLIDDAVKYIAYGFGYRLRK